MEDKEDDMQTQETNVNVNLKHTVQNVKKMIGKLKIWMLQIICFSNPPINHTFKFLKFITLNQWDHSGPKKMEHVARSRSRDIECKR